MRVIRKEPGKHPEIAEIENTLKTLQDEVGGYIEAIPMGNAAVICNEEGRLQGLKPNCKVNGVSFVGNILIVGVAEEDFCDIPEELEEKIVGGAQKC